jgi:hypothetical protein
MPRNKVEDLGPLTDQMAVSILQKVGTNTAHMLGGIERLHVLYAVLDRCEETSGWMAST